MRQIRGLLESCDDEIPLKGRIDSVYPEQVVGDCPGVVEVDAMRPIAERHGVSVARVALAWLLHQKVTMSVIIGAKTSEQLRDNLAASDLRLSDDELAALDKASALTPEYPAWMVERQNSDRVPGARRG